MRGAPVMILCNDTDLRGRGTAAHIGSRLEWTVRPFDGEWLRVLLPAPVPVVRWRLDLYPLTGTEPVGTLTGVVEWIEELSYEGELRQQVDGWRIEPVAGTGRRTVAAWAPSGGPSLTHLSRPPVSSDGARAEGWHSELEDPHDGERVRANDWTLVSVTDAVIVRGPPPG